MIVDHRVGIYPFSVNKCDVTDMLLAMVLRRYVFNQHNALNDRSAEQNVAGITLRICNALENTGNISNTIILVHCLEHFWNSHVA